MGGSPGSSTYLDAVMERPLPRGNNNNDRGVSEFQLAEGISMLARCDESDTVTDMEWSERLSPKQEVTYHQSKSVW